MDITAVITGVITLLAAIITYIVAPLIKAKTTSAQWAAIVSWTSTAVQAAEVLYKGAGQGEVKRDYVIKYVYDMCEKNGFEIDTESVRNALEQAWKSMQGV